MKSYPFCIVYCTGRLDYVVTYQHWTSILVWKPQSLFHLEKFSIINQNPTYFEALNSNFYHIKYASVSMTLELLFLSIVNLRTTYKYLYSKVPWLGREYFYNNKVCTFIIYYSNITMYWVNYYVCEFHVERIIFYITSVLCFRHIHRQVTVHYFITTGNII